MIFDHSINFDQICSQLESGRIQLLVVAIFQKLQQSWKSDSVTLDGSPHQIQPLPVQELLPKNFFVFEGVHRNPTSLPL